MEARPSRIAFALFLTVAAVASLGAGHRTQNFISSAPTQQLAVEIGDAAEKYRRDLAIEWLGVELPAWEAPCPITCKVASNLGAGGQTSFMFDRSRPFGWTMIIQGSRERILDSVLPHEVTHTIFATHFGRPLPRWADEGACTTVEHSSERNKQEKMLLQFLTTNRGIAFNKMFAIKEYPHDVMPLYSQGYSLVRYLLAHGGKRKFVAYVGDGMNANNWTAATQKHYGYQSLSELQVTWLEWVRGGSGDVRPNEQLAAHDEPATPLVAIARPSPRNLVPVSEPVDALPSNAASGERAAPARAPRPTDLAHSSNLASGWYAKQRDRAASQGGSESSFTQDRTASERSGIVRTIHEERSQPQVVTRPQPIGRPEQVILEWSKQPASGVRSGVPMQALPPYGNAYR